MSKSKNKKQKKDSFWKPFIFISFIGFIIIALIYFLRYTSFYAKSIPNNLKTPQKELFKIHKTLVEHPNLMIGIDVSYYQQEINFDSLAIYFKRPIQVFICRASAGNNYKDSFVNRNIKKARKKGFLIGAYHYYRPNENSYAQADQFLKSVQLKKGDLPPILDIEELPTEQSVKKLQEGLKNWISIVELKYGIKPILYSSDSFYSYFLKQHFSDYPLWVANYNWISQPKNKNWIGWQFSDKAIVKGINHYVDLNVFKPEIKNLILK